jgi:hypothetical protein
MQTKLAPLDVQLAAPLDGQLDHNCLIPQDGVLPGLTDFHSFGETLDQPSNSSEYMILGFCPTGISLKQRWRNNGLSADFLADYMTVFFPNPPGDDSWEARIREFKGAVSYVSNELLENAMKYNDEGSCLPIDVQMHLYADHVLFQVTNSMVPDRLEPFKAFIQTLLTEDLGELYIQQLEASAADEHSGASGLGLITMVQDYQARLGWQFKTYPPVAPLNLPVTTVTTIVRLLV